MLRGRLKLARAQVAAGGKGLTNALSRQAERARARLERAQLRSRAIDAQVADEKHRLARAIQAMEQAQLRNLAATRDRLSGLGRMLGSLGYTETLRRGFAVVRDGEDGPLIAGRVDGRMTVGADRPAKPTTSPKGTDPQGSLF